MRCVAKELKPVRLSPSEAVWLIHLVLGSFHVACVHYARRHCIVHASRAQSSTLCMLAVRHIMGVQSATPADAPLSLTVARLCAGMLQQLTASLMKTQVMHSRCIVVMVVYAVYVYRVVILQYVERY